MVFDFQVFFGNETQKSKRTLDHLDPFRVFESGGGKRPLGGFI